MDSSRSWPDGHANSVFRLIVHAVCGFLVALYALGMSLPAHAGGGEYIPRGQPIPQSIRWKNATPGGANTSASASFRDAMNRTTYHNLPVPVSSSTLGKLVNGAIKRGLPVVGWGLTLKSLIDGAGWAIDSLAGQVTTTPRPQEQLQPMGWCAQLATQTFCVNSIQAMRELLNQQYASRVADGRVTRWDFTDRNTTPPSMNFCGVHPNGGCNVSGVTYWRTTSGSVNGHPAGQEAVPISPDQLGQLVKAQPQVVNAILIDPQTGAPIRTAELTDALNNLRRSLESANGMPPGQDLAPAPDVSAPVPSESEWPDFCGWANRLCDWLFDVEPAEEHPAVPYHEVDPTELEDYDSGFGGGSCPAPYSTSVLAGEFEIQWDGLCGFVEYLRPLVVALAWVLAAFVVVNSAKRA